MGLMQRYFVNQPSTLQVAHKFHGCNVLADLDDRSLGDVSLTVYFQCGPIISAVLPRMALSRATDEKWNSKCK